MKRLFVVFLFLLSKADAQVKPVPAVLAFTSGVCEGVMDGLQFYYDKDNQFWNPDISWVNKYKGRDPQNGLSFRGRFFVWTTDGWHLVKGIRNTSGTLAIVFSFGEPKKKF